MSFELKKSDFLERTWVFSLHQLQKEFSSLSDKTKTLFHKKMSIFLSCNITLKRDHSVGASKLIFFCLKTFEVACQHQLHFDNQSFWRLATRKKFIFPHFFLTFSSRHLWRSILTSCRWMTTTWATIQRRRPKMGKTNIFKSKIIDY